MIRTFFLFATIFICAVSKALFAGDSAVGRFVEVTSYCANATETAEFADQHIARLCAEFDYSPKQWRRTPVVIHANRPGYGEGFAETVFGGGEQYCGRVEIKENFPEALRHALPHELTHTWVAYSVRFPFALFLNESLASSQESPDHVRDNILKCAELRRAGKLKRPFAYLNQNISLPIRSPHEMENIREYYAAACAFASFCYELPGGKPNYLRFCSRLSGRVPVSQADFQKAILDFYGFGSEDDFNAAFYLWVESR